MKKQLPSTQEQSKSQIRIADMSAKRIGTFTLYRAPVTDRLGKSHYEVSIHGTRKLVETTIGKSGLEIDIDPDATEQDAKARAEQLLRPYYERLDSAMHEPWNIAAHVPSKVAAKAANTITISVRRTAGKGTLWAIATPVAVAWPRGTMIQFVIPRCFTGGATSLPLAGNPNIAIRFNTPFAPIAAESARGGLAIDAASFMNAPWFHVYSWNQFVAAGPTPAVAFLSCWGFGLLPF